MKRTDDDLRVPDKRLAAVCGLFCPACTIFIGTREDPERLKPIVDRVRKSVDELKCDGCRTEKRCFYCRERCKMAKCASDRGLEFCGECPEYPCRDLKVFQAEMPHRIELWKSQERIRAVGYKKWYSEMIEHYSCSKCGTINSTYDLTCRKCGASPGSAYVALHREEIVRQLAKMTRP